MSVLMFLLVILFLDVGVETEWIMVLSRQKKQFVSENLICKWAPGFFWKHI